MNARAIGDRPLGLAAHLRRAADLLLDTTTSSTYNWSNPTACNCGIVSRSIREDYEGVSVAFNRLANRFAGLPEDTSRMWRILSAHPPGVVRRHLDATWSNLAAEYCVHNPGETMPEVLSRLLAAGLEPTDFEHLEFLRHPELVDSSWVLTAPPVYGADLPRDAHYKVAANAAYYLLAWAKAIEVYHAAHPVAPAEAPFVEQSIPSTAAVLVS